MTELIQFFTNSFSSCVWLAIFLVAFCPLLEGKIAIPLALNSALWMGKALSPAISFIISFIGSSLPCLFMIFLARKLKSKTTGFISSNFVDKYLVKANQLNKYKNFKKCLILCGFSSLPLPLTGVWSSSLIAGLSDIKISHSIISILIGNLISCSITLLLCTSMINSVGNICLISILIVIIFLLFNFLIKFIENKRLKKVK